MTATTKAVTTANRSAGGLAGAVGAFLHSRWIGPIGLFVGLAGPLIIATPYAMNVMTGSLIFVMLAVGLNIVVGQCGLLDLGYAAFFAVGAYVSGVLSTRLHWPLLATVPFVVITTVVAGIVIGGPTLRLRSDYLAIVTLGFGEIIRITANNISVTGGPEGIYGIPSLSVGGVDLSGSITFYYVVLGVVAAAVLGANRLIRSRLGRAWRFIREDEDAAEAMGVHTYRVKLAAYIAGAVWGGLAGVLFAAQLSAISPASFTFLQSALVLMAVVLGGMGSTPGVVLGAVFVSVLPEVLRSFADYRYFVFGVLLIVVMVLRPQGLWPARTREPDRTARRSPAGVQAGVESEGEVSVP
ncbi:branched-chain amino acid ABC transporter permease [Streptomyces pluripotens]|uniref:Branched-chain amino acid ABC transporter permease n=1 Tax=Streptomyces pluripotens TaxID=1355015 RepID=A0A221NS54_9ACTN|nr:MULTISPECIES: branched-chain amino acid ABC transporter permease [Streptomyces]ASN22774.1 branched-chain amino acid ABC transporter permease [Streptomyces pluripotens]MCH0558160.1 branched-chain amino acid ABC transporter permease [Streptomyces sp. MUM 16J]